MPLTIGPIEPKFDRAYKAGDRETDAVVVTNLARLECSCAEWQEQRAGFPANDLRRVCPHLYDKLYATKVEKRFTLLQQLYIRYGRSMLDFRVVRDEEGVFLIGQPFGPRAVRTIGELTGAKPLLATYDFYRGWNSGETPVSEQMQSRVLARMKAALPEAFVGHDC